MPYISSFLTPLTFLNKCSAHMYMRYLGIWFLPPESFWNFSFEGHSGHPISRSSCLCLPWQLLLHHLTLKCGTSPLPCLHSCQFFTHSGLWWTNPTLPLTSSHIIICELNPLEAQSPVCTCPLVISTWTVHKARIPARQNSSFIHCSLPHDAKFPSGTFLTFYECGSTGLTLRMLWMLRLPPGSSSCGAAVCCPQMDMLPGRWWTM